MSEAADMLRTPEFAARSAPGKESMMVMAEVPADGPVRLGSVQLPAVRISR
jgi:hypothetical protein